MDSLNDYSDKESVASIENPQIKSTNERDHHDGRTEHMRILADQISQVKSEQADKIQRDIQWSRLWNTASNEQDPQSLGALALSPARPKGPTP